MQKVNFLLAFFLLAGAYTGTAQKLFTRDAVVRFDATAPNSPEIIKAISKSNSCVLIPSSGAVEMAVMIKGFQFERALMQEHFNENYLESGKFPKAIFKGKLDNPSAILYDKDGAYQTNVSGSLTLHGVTKNISAPIKIQVKGSKCTATVNFSVQLADYSIAIPSLVEDKVNKTVSLSIESTLEPIK